MTVGEMALSAGLATGLQVRGRDIAVIQDTSEIMVGQAEAGRAGFGPIGKGGATRGVLVHAAIAIDGAGALLGLVDQQVWTRKGGKVQDDRKRAFSEKESYRWLQTSEVAAQRLKAARSITMVSDAESDIYDYFAQRPQEVHFLVRSARDRRLKSGVLLSQTIADMAVKGLVERTIPAIPGRKERLATLELRFGQVTLNGHSSEHNLVLTVLDVCEVNGPAHITPVHWLLLTSHVINDSLRACEIIDLYRGRFLIEQLFRTLKTAGFNIEDVEIEDPHAFITFTAMAVIAAVSVMQLVKARSGGSGQRHEDCFQPTDRPLMRALSHKLEGKTAKQKNPHPVDDLAFAAWVIARLGGWTGYYGKPGLAVMRYGLDRYNAIKLGAEIAKNV